MTYLEGKKNGKEIPDKYSLEARLNKLTPALLKAFLKNKKDTTCPSKTLKKGLVKHILANYSKKTIFTHVQFDFAQKADAAIHSTTKATPSMPTTAMNTDI